jgi:thiosulfate/3-mercaptopyruvate sulfurtransferase
VVEERLGPVVSADALRELLASERDVVLLDARASHAAYDAGHLPGARWASLEQDLSDAAAPGADPARGGRHPLPSLERWSRTLGAWGISPETFVVAYDDQAGANAAARAWWMLRSIGHENAAVLDGGIDAARGAGFELTAAPPRVEGRPPYPPRRWQRPTADIADVDRLRNDPSWRVLDVRSRERFAGETEPIDPIAGHIPGAVNLPFSENLSNDRFKPPEALREMYESLLGDVGPDRLIVHCGSGVTACHTLLALERAGLSGAALYVGSWSEWCRRAGTAVIA